jgi:hypothetical protein
MPAPLLSSGDIGALSGVSTQGGAASGAAALRHADTSGRGSSTNARIDMDAPSLPLPLPLFLRSNAGAGAALCHGRTLADTTMPLSGTPSSTDAWRVRCGATYARYGCSLLAATLRHRAKQRQREPDAVTGPDAAEQSTAEHSRASGNADETHSLGFVRWRFDDDTTAVALSGVLFDVPAGFRCLQQQRQRQRVRTVTRDGHNDWPTGPPG